MRRKKDDPTLPRGNSSDVKPNIIEVEMKIGHKRVMAISRFFMDRDDPDHLVDQMIYDMEGIRDTIAEVANIMDNYFVIYFFSRWIRHALSVSIYVFSSWIGMWDFLITLLIDDM